MNKKKKSMDCPKCKSLVIVTEIYRYFSCSCGTNWVVNSKDEIINYENGGD